MSSLNNPKVILSAMLVVALYEDQKVNSKKLSLYNLFQNIPGPLFAQSSRSYYDQSLDCVLRATGLAGAGVLLNEGIKEGLKKLGVKGTLKMVGKFTGRALSWIGIAWAVADFAYCMSR